MSVTPRKVNQLPESGQDTGLPPVQGEGVNQSLCWPVLFQYHLDIYTPYICFGKCDLLPIVCYIDEIKTKIENLK